MNNEENKKPMCVNPFDMDLKTALDVLNGIAVDYRFDPVEALTRGESSSHGLIVDAMQSVLGDDDWTYITDLHADYFRGKSGKKPEESKEDFISRIRDLNAKQIEKAIAEAKRKSKLSLGLRVIEELEPIDKDFFAGMTEEDLNKWGYYQAKHLKPDASEKELQDAAEEICIRIRERL